MIALDKWLLLSALIAILNVRDWGVKSRFAARRNEEVKRS